MSDKTMTDERALAVLDTTLAGRLRGEAAPEGQAVAERHKLYGTRWITQLRDMEPGTQWFIAGRADPIATVRSVACVIWHCSEADIPHGTKYYTSPQPAAPVGVEGLPQPFGYVEPRHDLSGYEVFDEPSPRRAAIWNMHGMRKALAQTRAHYSIDADPDGIRERVADAITGALSFGAQGAHKPPAGHWLEPFWDMARAEREATVPPTVDEAMVERAAPAPVAGDAVDRLLSEFEMLVKHPDTSPIVSTTLTHVVSKMSAALAQDRASQAATADGTAASVLALADSWERGLLSIPRQPGASMIKSAIKDVRAAVAQACRTPTPAAEGEVP